MSKPEPHRVAIIGTGVVGTALGVALSRCGCVISGVADLTAEVAREAAERMGGVAYSENAVKVAKGAAVVILTTPDDAISEICRAIAAGGGFDESDIVLHCSGALSSDALASARACGASVGCMHPIGVFADIETAAAHLPHLWFGLEGDARAVEEAEAIVDVLGGRPLRVPKKQKILIHIAACLMANYTVTLTDMAVQLLGRLRIPREEAVRVLLPLLKGAIGALEDRGLPQALTGPIARGDAATVERHLKAMRSETELTRIYDLLGLRTLPIAVEKGRIDRETARRLREMLKKSLESGLSE